MDWPQEIFAVLRERRVTQVAHVPDGGHASLLRLVEDEPQMRSIPLTTEEEGVALLCGTALGGARGVLLMQSSGVGNCVNMLSMVGLCGFPFLALVTMRGEWGEFNPWQVPMGRATEAAFGLMGVACLRADAPADVRPSVEAAAAMAYDAGQPVAVLLGQRLIGAKVFAR
jgi:sulfopyruvate decarboxylase alpha subunit